MEDDLISLWQNAPQGDVLMKSMKDTPPEPKSALIDPYNYQSMSAGTRSKPTSMSYAMLRRMSKVPAIAAILLTRKNQAARYTRRPRYDGDMGFKITLKDPKAQMSDAARKRAMEIEDFMLKTGGVKNRKRKDNFNTFLRKLIDDSLTLDTMVFEKVGNMKGKMAELWAVDAATIELVANAPVSEAFQLPVYMPTTKAGIIIPEEVAYVQRINGQVVAEYTEEELAYAIRNPRTDIEFTDFGMSELEVLVDIVTGILNGVSYNTTYFNSSHLPQGVMELVGKYKDTHLEGFKRHWKQLTSGASGKWAVPIMALEEGQGFKFTPFKNSNKDMEFNEFLEFLFNIACAVYQIDPNEVGFKSWTSKSGTMGNSDNTEAKMESSQDKGFIPLMNFLADTFNSEIIDEIDEDFEFQWIGVDEQDEDKKQERQEKQVNMGAKTIRMIWEEANVDLDKVAKDNGGTLPKWIDAPANAQLIQVYMAETGLGQQAEPGQDPEDPNAEASIEQAQADDAHEKGKEVSDDEHGKQLEIMDKQHEQTIEAKKMDQQHQVKLEGLKAQNAKALAKDKPKPGEGKPEKPGEDPDDKHDKELEKMDKEHQLNMKEKKADQTHETKIETMKAKAAKAKASAKPKPKGKTVKKSLTSELDTVQVTVSWEEY